VNPTARFYLGLYRGCEGAIVLTTAAAIVQALLGLPISLLLRRLFDQDFSQSMASTAGAASAILALYLGGDALQLWQTDRVMRVTKACIVELREHLLEAMYRMPRVHDRASEVGRIQAALVHEVERVDALGSGILARIVPACLSAAALFAVLAILSWQLFLIALLVLPFTWGLTLLVRRPARASLDHFHRALEDASAGSLAALQRVDLARITGAVARERAEQRAHFDELRRAGHRVAWIQAALGLTQIEVSTVAGIVILVVGRSLVGSGTLSFGTLIAFYVVLAMVRAQVSAAIVTLPAVAGGVAALRRLDTLLGEAVELPYRGTRPIAFAGRIALERVAFDYRDQPVLRDASLMLEPGEIVAVAGANGAGKTTIARLVLGLERPSHGRLCADDRDYDAIDLAGVRARTGFAAQDPTIFAATLHDNLTFGLDRTPSEREIAVALELAGADFVARLPDGRASWLGDEGARLSGGERQRLSIARALLRDPVLLILDEPTNHLGAAETRAILMRIRAARPQAAVLLISHDPAMLACADRIYWLEDGVLHQRFTAPQPLVPPARAAVTVLDFGRN